MSKLALSISALILASQPVLANTVAVTDVEQAHCHSVHVADAGYDVQVVRQPDGKLELSLYTISFFGTTRVGTLRVEKLEDLAQVTRSYIGKNLALAIDLSQADANGDFSARISGSVLPYNEFTDLACTVQNPKLAPLPIQFPITCMAYFSGAEFNPALGACEMTGKSGCSNPFEFSSVSSCEVAYELK